MKPGSNSKALSQRAKQDRKEPLKQSTVLFCCYVPSASSSLREPAGSCVPSHKAGRRCDDQTKQGSQVGEVVCNKNKTRALIIFKWPLFLCVCARPRPTERKGRDHYIYMKSAAPREWIMCRSSLYSLRRWLRASIGDEKNRASSVLELETTTARGDERVNSPRFPPRWACKRVMLKEGLLMRLIFKHILSRRYLKLCITYDYESH